MTQEKKTPAKVVERKTTTGEAGKYYIRTAGQKRDVIQVDGDIPRSPDDSGRVTRYSGPFASAVDAESTLARMTARKS